MNHAACFVCMYVPTNMCIQLFAPFCLFVYLFFALSHRLPSISHGLNSNGTYMEGRWFLVEPFQLLVMFPTRSFSPSSTKADLLFVLINYLHQPPGCVEKKKHFRRKRKKGGCSSQKAGLHLVTVFTPPQVIAKTLKRSSLEMPWARRSRIGPKTCLPSRAWWRPELPMKGETLLFFFSQTFVCLSFTSTLSRKK